LRNLLAWTGSMNFSERFLWGRLTSPPASIDYDNLLRAASAFNASYSPHQYINETYSMGNAPYIPVELVLYIISYVDNIETIISLARTCRLFANLVRPILKRLQDDFFSMKFDFDLNTNMCLFRDIMEDLLINPLHATSVRKLVIRWHMNDTPWCNVNHKPY